MKSFIIRLFRISRLEKDPYKSTPCMTLFSKIGLASDRIDEMKRSKDQNLSTLNFSSLKIIYKLFQNRFPGPNQLSYKTILENIIEICSEGFF
jgi:hypothetical protein